MVKGRLASGFCWPTLTWAQTAADARVRSNAVFAKRIVMSPYLPVSESSISTARSSSRHRNRHGLAGAAFGDPDRVARRLDCVGVIESFLDRSHLDASPGARGPGAH